MWLRFITVAGLAASCLSVPRNTSVFNSVSKGLCGTASEPAARLNVLIERNEREQQAIIGTAILSLRLDSLIYAHNAAVPMLPASNQKLLVTGLALTEGNESLIAQVGREQRRRVRRTHRPARGYGSNWRTRGSGNALSDIEEHSEFPECESISGVQGYDILCRINKLSDNHLANQLLSVVMHKHRRNSQQLIAQSLADLGVWCGGLNAIDGSGRSSTNRATALTIVQLLHRMARSPRSTAYVGSLARAGIDGTLRRHIFGPGERVIAKTGTIAGTYALSGYLFQSHDTLAFSILLNKWYDKPEAFRFFDELLSTLDREWYMWHAVNNPGSVTEKRERMPSKGGKGGKV